MNQIQHSLVIHLLKRIVRGEMLHTGRTVNNLLEIIDLKPVNFSAVRNISLNQTNPAAE